MEYKELLENMGSLNVLSNLRNKAGIGVLYRRPYNAKKLNIECNNMCFSFDLEQVKYLCSSPEGLQLQEENGCLTSFFLEDICEIEIIH